MQISALANHPSYPVRLFAEDMQRLREEDRGDEDPRENFVQTTGVETYAEGQPKFVTQHILSETSIKSRCLNAQGAVSWVRTRSISESEAGVNLFQEAVSLGSSAGRSFRSDGDKLERLSDPGARLQELNREFEQEWLISGL